MIVDTKNKKVYIGFDGIEYETPIDAVKSLVIGSMSELVGGGVTFEMGELVKHRDVVIKMLQSVDEAHTET